MMKGLPIAFICMLTLAGCNQSTETVATEAPPPAEVDVAQPLRHNLTEWEEFTGRFEALNSVDIRARVTGYLVEKRFKDGQFVNEGEVLFVIDPRPFEYQVERAKAQNELAKKEYERARSLRETRAISQEEVDRRFQEVSVTAAELKDAQLALSFTQVKAPISGKASDNFTDVGNLVRENDSLLTRVVSTDPIHFRFEATQAQLLKYLRMDRAGTRASSDTSPNPIFIKLVDEDKYQHTGTMDFVDNLIDPGTGTIQGRALVENKDGLIYPGLFGKARLLGRDNYEAILLPEKAINTDQNRKFVYAVNTDNEIYRLYVMPGNVLDNGYIVINEGLQGNEQVVINGIQRIRSNGQEVSPLIQTLAWEELATMPAYNLGKKTTKETGLAESIQTEASAQP